jgi:hypothetical protein
LSAIKRTDKQKVHLVIPDSHATPEFNNRRYSWLGHLINDLNGPNVDLTVIDIGDWYDMASLNSYDKGAKKAYEGRQYKKDIDIGVDGQERVLTVVRRQKQKLPRFVRTLGNHEARILKAIESDPVLEGTIGLTDLQSKEYLWEEFPFLEPVDIDGIVYQHYFVTGVSGRPIGGDNTAKMLLQKNFKSCTQGHSHLFDHAIRTDADGNRLHGLVVGCFLEENLEWADPTAHLWYQGVCICRDVEDGSYDLQHVGIEALRRAYGGRDA